MLPFFFDFFFLSIFFFLLLSPLPCSEGALPAADTFSMKISKSSITWLKISCEKERKHESKHIQQSVGAFMYEHVFLDKRKLIRQYLLPYL